jgi:EmrB/QacA subfamily drug resistance transporter
MKSTGKLKDAQPYPGRWWALAAICVPLIVVSIDGTILNVALPTIAGDLQATSSQLIWINSAYVIIFGSTILLGGSLGDRYGRKLFLELGLLVFVAGSIWAGLSTNSYSLVLARGFMGVGGGMIMPATLSLIANIFPENERQRAIGVWAGMAGIGVAVGPLAGGLILTHFKWGMVFFVNVPVVAVGVVAVWLLVPGSKASAAPPVDAVGASLSFLGLLAFFYGLIVGPGSGWSDPSVIISMALAVVLLALFVRFELRVKNPLMEIRFFRIPAFSTGVISIAIGFFALYGLLYVLTLYLQSVLAYSPMKAGLALVPFALVLFAGSPLVPRLVTRLGGRTVVAAGLFFTCAGMLVFTQVSTSTAYPLVFVGLVLVSTGLTLAQVPSSDAIMGSIPRDKAGEGSAMNAAIRQIGSSLGIAIIGGVSQLGYSNTLAKSQAFQALSASSAKTAESGIAGALSVSQGLGGAGDALAGAARSAFVKGLDVSMVITAAIALVGAVLACRYIPRKSD